MHVTRSDRQHVLSYYIGTLSYIMHSGNSSKVHTKTYSGISSTDSGNRTTLEFPSCLFALLIAYTFRLSRLILPSGRCAWKPFHGLSAIVSSHQIRRSALNVCCAGNSMVARSCHGAVLMSHSVDASSMACFDVSDANCALRVYCAVLFE